MSSFFADFPVMFIKRQKMLKTSQIQQFNGHIQARFARRSSSSSDQFTTNHVYLTTLRLLLPQSNNFILDLSSSLLIWPLGKVDLSFFLKGRPVHPRSSWCLTKYVLKFLPVFIPFCQQHHNFEPFGLSVQTH